MWLRKLAHIGVYFVEGALLFPALRRTLRGAGTVLIVGALNARMKSLNGKRTENSRKNYITEFGAGTFFRHLFSCYIYG